MRLLVKRIVGLGMLFASLSASSKTQINVCLTGSTVKVIPEYGEAFLNGARLAVSELEKIAGVEIKIQEHFYDPTPLSPLRAVEKMVSANCHAIVGFSDQNDLLTVSKLIEKGKILVVSIYGELNETLRSVPHILTMQPSPSYLVDKLAHFLKENKKEQNIKNVLLATSIDKQSLLEYRKVYNKYFESIKANVEQFEFLERSLDESKLKTFIEKSNKSYDTIVALGRAVNAAKVVDVASSLLKTKPLVLGTKNFGSSILPAFLQRLENKNVNAYFPRHGCLCDPDPKVEGFVLRYENTYGKKPMVISAHAFDAVKYIGKVVVNAQREKKRIQTPSQITDSAKNTQDIGITGVRLGPNFEMEYTKYFIMRVDEDTYRLADYGPKIGSQGKAR